MPSRVSPVERVRAEIDQLFADSARDLGEVLEEVARLGARRLLQTALEAESPRSSAGTATSAVPTPILGIATAISR